MTPPQGGMTINDGEANDGEANDSEAK